MNRVCIFMFFRPSAGDAPVSYCKSQKLLVFNLNGYGTLIFYVFNLFSILGVLSHLRCANADPGTIPKNIYVP